MPFYKINNTSNRIELYFEQIPSYSHRNLMKSNGWWWDPEYKCWWNKINDATLAFAKTQGPQSPEVTREQFLQNAVITAKGKCGNNARWTLIGSDYLFITGSGEIDGVDYDHLSGIPWYEYIYKIEKVIIQDGITCIGKRAFHNCQQLKEVQLPNSITKIDDRAFSGCKNLVAINMPVKLSEIGMHAFKDCISLQELRIPKSVTKIGEGCFKGWKAEQTIYRTQTDPITGKITTTTISPTNKVEPVIHFEDFVTISTNPYCVSNGHICEPIQAQVNVLQRDGNLKTVIVPAGYCQTCKKYYIGYWQFEKLKKQGVVMCRMMHEKISSASKTGGGFFEELSPESILKQSGYSVSSQDDLTDTQRQHILICLMESNICQKAKILSHLSWLIKSREGQMHLEDAIYKWNADRNFVDAYKMGSARIVAMKSLRIRK